MQADLSIRGASFGKTLVLLNGMRLNDPQSGHHNMDIPVPLESVERVEVMRGSGSTLYGADAVGGVINIITEPPADHGIPPAHRTRQRRHQPAARLARHRRQESLRATLFLARFFFRLPARPRLSQSAISPPSHALATDIGNGSINLAYMDHPFGADQFYGNFNSWEDTKTWFAGVQQAFGAKTTASFSFRRHSDLFVLYRDRPEVFTNHHSDESYQLASAAARRCPPPLRSTTAWRGCTNPSSAIISATTRAAAAAAYAAADFRALKRFSLTISAREELYRSFSAAFTPTVAAGCLALAAVEAPRLHQPRLPHSELHRPLLSRPRQSWAIPTCVRRAPGLTKAGVDWVPSARIRGDLTLFERRERDGIDYYRTSATDIWRALNIQNLNFKGWEAALRWTPSLHAHRRFPFYRNCTARRTQSPRASPSTRSTTRPRVGVFGWQITPRGNFVLRTRVGVIERLERSPYAAVGHLRRAPAPQGAPLPAGEQRDQHVVPVDPRRGDAGAHDCRRSGSGDSKALNRTDSRRARDW